MNDFTVKEFKRLARERFAFLEARGFRCDMNTTESVSTGGKVTYLGNHVGFIVSLDLRDRCIDFQVLKVQNGRLEPSWAGGYSSDLFSHLVKYAGYRGSVTRANNVSSKRVLDPSMERMLDAWVEMLVHEGQRLLDDNSDALP